MVATLATFSRAAEPALIDRGRYIVHQVALCADCHSPRDEKGQFVPGREFTGAPLAFKATVPMPWAPVAPNIAGLPNFTDEQAVKFMMTGQRPNGVPVMPPMPAFRMDADDAKAVVAYLRSLAAPQ